MSEVEVDPLLRELTEKKLSFKRNVVSLATELKDARTRLATQEHLCAHEIRTRQAAESKAKTMEEQVATLQNCLQLKDQQLHHLSSSTSNQFLAELDDLRSQLSLTRATAESSAHSAESARAHCSTLLEQLSEKGISLKQHEDRVNILGEQVQHLQKLLEARELSQQQLRDHVLQMEKQITSAVSKRSDSDSDSESHSHSDSDSDRHQVRELRRLLEEVSPKNIENLNRHLSAKDDEIARLRDEIRILSAHWINKTKELESQMEKHRRTDQELKKKILKLEFCLQESRSQIRKLQRMGERRDKALKELRDQMAMKQPYNHANTSNGGDEKNNFWESSGFKFMVSMSMLALIIVAKR